MSNIFLRKIVKMFTINLILHEFRFFVKLFLKKIPDDSVVLISVVRARLSPNGLGSGDPNLQGGAPLLIFKGGCPFNPYGYRRHLLIGCDSHSRAIFQPMLRIHNHLRF